MPVDELLKLGIQQTIKKPPVQAAVPKAAVVGAGVAAVASSEDAEAIGPTSMLKETIDALPDSFTMKAQNVRKYLKNYSQRSINNPIKDEEFELSGISGALQESAAQGKKLTKSDLQQLIANRTDHFDTTVNQTYSTTTLPELSGQDYRVKIRQYNNDLEHTPRDVSSHWKIPDYLSHTRSSVEEIDGEPGTLLIELQSDLRQRQRRYGGTLEEAQSRQESFKKLQSTLEQQYTELSKTLHEEDDRLTSIAQRLSEIRSMDLPMANNIVDEVSANLRGLTLEFPTAHLSSTRQEMAEMWDGDDLAYIFQSRVFDTTSDDLRAVAQSMGYKSAAKSSSFDIEHLQYIMEQPDGLATAVKRSPKLAKDLERFEILQKEVSDRTFSKIEDGNRFIEAIKDLPEDEYFVLDALRLAVGQPKEVQELIDADDLKALAEQGLDYSSNPENARRFKNHITLRFERFEEAVQETAVRETLTTHPEFAYLRTSLSTPSKNPFQGAGMVKDLEEQLLDAEMHGRQFVAVPLEVGPTELLARAPSVQKYYSEDVREGMQHLVEKLNRKIRQQAIYEGRTTTVPTDQGSVQYAQLDPEELFKYSERRIAVQSDHGISDATINTAIAGADGSTIHDMYSVVTSRTVASAQEIAEQQGVPLSQVQAHAIADEVGSAFTDTSLNADQIYYITQMLSNGVALDLPTTQFTDYAPLKTAWDALDEKVQNAVFEELKISGELLESKAFRNLENPSQVPILVSNVLLYPAGYSDNMDTLAHHVYRRLLPQTNEGHTLGVINLPKKLSHVDRQPQTIRPANPTELEDVLEQDPDGPLATELANKLGGNVEDYYGAWNRNNPRVANIFEKTIEKHFPRQANWMQNISLYGAAPAGISQQLIDETLREEGVTAQNLEDYLVSELGHDRTKAKSAIEKIINAKIKASLDAGASTDDVIALLEEKGYSLEDIERLMPSDDLLTDFYKTTGMYLAKQFVSFENLYGNMSPTYQSLEQKQAANVAARAVAANETVLKIWNDLSAPLSRELKVVAKAQSDALNYEIVAALNRAEIQAQVDEYGEIWVPDSNGDPKLLNVSTMQMLLAHKYEIISGMSLGAAGFKAGLAAPIAHPLLKSAAATVTGAIAGGFGAASGRGMDMLENMIYNKQELDGKFMWDEMIATGAADAALGLVIPLGMEMTGWSAKQLYKAYDLVAQGNSEGANRALLELMHIDAEEAKTLVKEWEQVANQKAPGFTQAQKNLHVIPRTVSDAYALIGPAAKESSLGSITLAKEIDSRAKDIIKQVQEGTSDRVGAILRHEMPQFKERVQNYYSGVKNYGIHVMKDSPYRFDYDRVALEPILEKLHAKVHNPAKKEQILSMLKRAKALGGTEATVEAPAKITEEVVRKFRRSGPAAATRTRPVTKQTTKREPTLRSFKDLLELRTLVNEIGSKRSLTKFDDIGAIAAVRKRIDKEIAKAIRLELGAADGKAWLKEWGQANQAYQNMFELQKNVLYKGIMRRGSTNDQITRTLMKSALATDDTYFRVMQALPDQLKIPTENAVLREIVEKFTVGEETGKQAIDFVPLAQQLKHIPFSSPSARNMKRAVNAFAEVFKNDPASLAHTGVIKTPAFQPYLTADPVIRMKYWAASTSMNYVKRLAPTQGGREIAMVMKVAKYLEDPTDVKTIQEVIKSLPEDEIYKNELKAAAVQIAKWYEKPTGPEVEVFGSAAEGYSTSPVNGPLGTGVYYYINKGQARTKSRLTGGKLSKRLIHPDRIADEALIREVLNLPEDIPVTPKLIRETPELEQLLINRMKNGIVIGDEIMLF